MDKSKLYDLKLRNHLLQEVLLRSRRSGYTSTLLKNNMNIIADNNIQKDQIENKILDLKSSSKVALRFEDVIGLKDISFYPDNLFLINYVQLVQELLEEKMTPIVNSFTDEYRFLSNFYPCDILVEDDVNVSIGYYIFPSVENAYQASKLDWNKVSDFDIIKFVHCTPSEAKRMGKEVELRLDWNEVKLQIMYDLCYIKFSRYPELKQKLIDTFPSILIEGNTWNDTYWGVCNGKGENHLGIILMNIREELMKDSLMNARVEVMEGVSHA